MQSELEQLFRGGRSSSGPLSAILIAAHPDDEVIGAGGMLQELSVSYIIHVTDGAPRKSQYYRSAGFATREGYAEERRRELLAALQYAGIRPDQCLGAGLVDQEASFHLYELAGALADFLRAFKPHTVLAPSYEGGHPDHDAAAFVVHTACRMLEKQGGAAPVIIEFPLYNAYKGVNSLLEFIPFARTGEIVMPLTEQALSTKRRMIECFRTQREVLNKFPITASERFRPAPLYNFMEPPHSGRLYYEGYDWGVTGDQWRGLAAVAAAKLKQEDRL